MALYRVVSEIFNVEKYRDLEIWVIGQRLLKVTDNGTIRKIGYVFLLVFCSNLVPKTRHFSDIRLVTQWPWNPGYGHSRSSELTRIDLPPITSYWRSIATMGLSRTVSEINGDFSRQSQIFPTPCTLCPRWRGSPWNWVSALGLFFWLARSKKTEWWSYLAEKEVWRYLQPSGYNAPMWQTDGRMDRRTPRIASRRKNRADQSTTIIACTLFTWN